MRDRRGFSLVELLVVIGIIAVLAALLAPIYTNAKKQGVKVACQSNLSQISKAFESYLSDYDGCYPNTNNQYFWAGANWREPLRKYLAIGQSATSESAQNTVLSCPSDPTPPGIYGRTSYAYSAAFYMTPEQVDKVADNNYLRSRFADTNPTLPISTIKSALLKFATKKVLVAEYLAAHGGKNRVGWYDSASTGNDPWSGARNYLFADGHAAYLQTVKIHPADSPVVSRPRSLPDINLTTDGVAGKDID